MFTQDEINTLMTALEAWGQKINFIHQMNALWSGSKEVKESCVDRIMEKLEELSDQVLITDAANFLSEGE